MRLFLASFCLGCPCLESRVIGDSVKPVADGVSTGQRMRLTNQDKERGLKRIFRVVCMSKHATANAEDHRPMPPDQCLEGPVVFLTQKTRKQEAVGLVIPERMSANALNNVADSR